MTHELPTRFGKYVLLDRLAAGGMAEVFLAKVMGVESFERLLAIKCMRPELAKNDRFTSMFIDEAKLAGRLSHANIVQIYELGRYEDQLYIAMELIEGYDLRRIIDRACEVDEKIPETFAAYVIARAAFALDYAHSRTDSQGAPLCLVHRDISPPNLLVSAEGEVKVVDFGIAKASARISETRVGVLKGKIAYMSPEQARGDLVDGRTDIYTLGVVLYELLTGYRLYSGDTDFEILERVKHGTVPDLRVHMPQASPEMISVLMTALTKKLKKRYQRAAEMGKALEPLLIKDRSIFGATDAAEYIKKLFAEELARPKRLTNADLGDLALDLDDGWRDKTETFQSAFRPGEVGTPEPVVPLEPGGQPVRESSSAPTKIARSRTPVTRGDRPKSLERDWDNSSEEIDGTLGETVDPSAESQRKVTRRTRPAPAISTAADTDQIEPEEEEVEPRVWWPWLLVMLLCAGGGYFVYFLYGPQSPTLSGPTAVPEETRPFGTTKSNGYLTVKVTGSKNAIVYIDGRKVGKAPIRGQQVPTGVRTIKVKKGTGSKTRIKKITIKKGHTRSAPYVLTIKF